MSGTNPKVHTEVYKESSSYQRGPDGHWTGEYHAKQVVDGKVVAKEDYVDRDGRIQPIGHGTQTASIQSGAHQASLGGAQHITQTGASSQGFGASAQLGGIGQQPKTHSEVYVESSSYQRGPDGHWAGEVHSRHAVDGKLVDKKDYIDRDGRVQPIAGANQAAIGAQGQGWGAQSHGQ